MKDSVLCAVLQPLMELKDLAAGVLASLSLLVPVLTACLVEGSANPRSAKVSICSCDELDI